MTNEWHLNLSNGPFIARVRVAVTNKVQNNRWRHKMFKTASGTTSVASYGHFTTSSVVNKSAGNETLCAVCFFIIIFTRNLNRQASERVRVFVLRDGSRQLRVVCALIGNDREPIRNEYSGFLLWKWFSLSFLITVCLPNRRRAPRKVLTVLRRTTATTTFCMSR